MRDRVSAKPNRYAVYDDSHNFIRYEYHERADEPTQEGTALSKANLLSDPTAGKLDGVETPDAALSLLGRFNRGLGNEYVWEKIQNTYTNVFGTVGTVNMSGGSYSASATIYYSDSIDTSGNLMNPSSFNLTYSEYTAANAVKGKYWKSTYPYGNSDVYFTESNAPNATSGGADYYVMIQAKKLLEVGVVVTSYGYVNSPTSDAYPPAVSDGYTYTALGQFGAKVQIATGSYIGTGTYGASNPNSLTFDFVPRLLIMLGTTTNANGTLYTSVVFGNYNLPGRYCIYCDLLSTGYDANNENAFSGTNTRGFAKKSADGKTIYWYHTEDYYAQFNGADPDHIYTYYYMAIG